MKRLGLLLVVGLATVGMDGATASSSQRAILHFDEGAVPNARALASLGAGLVHEYASIPAVAIEGPGPVIERAAASLGARAVEFDRPLRYFMDTATTATRAADVWGEAWAPAPRERPSLRIGDTVIDGSGVTVGVVDTGIDATHPDLYYAPAWAPGVPMQPKVLACVNFPPPRQVMVDPEVGVTLDQSLASTPYCDQTVGHGTHVAGIVAGDSFAQRRLATWPLTTRQFTGAAPGAKLVGAGLGANLSIIGASQGLDYMWQHAERYGIRVVTNSWGDEPNCTSSLTVDSISAIVNKLVEKDVTVLFAAGNYNADGPTWTSTYSRNVTPGVLSVANYFDVNSGTRDGRIAQSSSDGCTVGASGQDRVWTWPDVAAPGSSIVATAAKTGVAIPPTTFAPFYGTASGTSMATPHVAGIVALMIQANPELTPAQVERILIETAAPWYDVIASRGLAGSEAMWGLENAEGLEFADRDRCYVSPADVADPEGSGADLARLGDLPAPDRFVCRDYRRGNGLVDAYAAVEAALALRE